MLALALFIAAGAPNAWALLVPARRVTRGSNRILSEASFEELKLVASDGAAVDYFGGSVAIDGSTIVVGASGDDDGADNSGSVYVLRTTDGGATYVELAKLTASDPEMAAYFGKSVAIDGDTIVVGSPYDDDAGSQSGSVYVFRTSNGWATHTEIELTAADTASGDLFGRSVAIDGNTIVVGTSNADAVYVFRTTDGGATYDELAKLTASDAAEGDRFGWSVAIDGGTIVVGTPYDDDAGLTSGSAYVFLTTDGGATYGQVAKLTASDGAASDYFGYSVAISGGTVVVGAYWDDDGGYSSGSVYVFSGAGSEGLVAGSDSTQTLGSDAATRTGPLLALLVAAVLAL